MKGARIHIPNLFFISAFVTGVILFASLWRNLFGAASSAIILAGIAGVAIVVTAFWLWNEFKISKDKDIKS